MQTVQLTASQTPYFDKETTAIIKGIALVMMFAHHFFTFPILWIDGIEYSSLEKIAIYFREPLKLCVSVFCFLSGYFYYYNKDKSYSYSFRKITDILIDYWGVFFLFSIIAVMTVRYVYTPVNFIKEMFALYRPTMYFCWYVSYYCMFMLLLPLLTKLLSRNVHFDIFFSVVLLPIIVVITSKTIIKFSVGIDAMNELLSNLHDWFPTVLEGYIFARYKLFNRMEYNLQKIIRSEKATIMAWVVGVLCTPMGRYVLPSILLITGVLPYVQKSMSFSLSMDVAYTPAFIFCVVNLCKNIKLTYAQFILGQIGKYSLLMWFVSCIFFNNSKTVFQPILYWPHNPVLVLIWGLLICYFVSALLDLGLSTIIKQKNKIIFHKI